jgi:transcriptional regulator with XRE-family HTH domain
MAKQYRDQDYLVKIGKRLVELRAEYKLSQEALERLSGVDTRQIGRIERAEGNTNISLIKKLADSLGIKVSQILDV